MNSLLFFIKKLSIYRKELCMGILLSILLATSSIALLTLSGWFISAAAFAGLSAVTATVFNYFIPASLIRLLAFIRILSRYFDRVINHDFTFKILAQLRVWFYEKLIPLAPAHLLSHQSGDLLNNMVNDTDTLDQLYLNIFSPLVVALFLLISVTFFTFYFTSTLAIIIFIMFFSSLTIISKITFKYSKKMGQQIQDSTAQLRTHTIDFLQGFTDLLLFVKKENRLSKINDRHEKLMLAQKKCAILKGFAIGAMQLFSGITVFLILFFGISQVRNHVITGAQLAMIILLIMAAFEQLISLPFAFLSLGKTKSASDRILKITNNKPAVIFCDQKNNLDQYDIAFKNVSFNYPNRPISVLKNINIEIPMGMHLGITGDSGSGKTTLVNLLARIWDPDSGEITINNINLKKFSEIDLRKMISLVTQHVHIFNVSVRDNLTLMQENISDEQLFSVLHKVDLADHIKSLPDGLNTLMGEFGKNFSGGQIRRISIARALLYHSPIMIFDEPSTGLEETLMQKIWKNCESDFKNKTIIVITHDEKLLALMNCVLFRSDGNESDSDHESMKRRLYCQAKPIALFHHMLNP